MRVILPFLALLAVAGCDRQKPEAQQGEAATPVAGVKRGVDRSHKGQPFPDVAFKSPSGDSASPAGFRGYPTLVNLWATWCAPCVKELPTLNRLAASLDPSAVTYTPENQLRVVAISQDMAPQKSVEAFLKQHLKIDNLGAYHDPDMALSSALGVQVMPTTILYDADGREVWRYVGDLDWTGAEATELLAEAG